MTGRVLRRLVSDVATVLSLDRCRAEAADRAAVLHTSAHAESRVLPAGGSNTGDDAWLSLPLEAGPVTVLAPPAHHARAAGPVLAYRALGALEAPDADEETVRVDAARPQGNSFQVVFESTRAAGAFLSIAAGRRVDAGPESERTWIVLAGRGLVFLQNETTLPVKAGDVAVVPPGEPARLWCRGPEDLRVIALQPQAPPAERRTLLGEVRRLRAEGRRLSGAGF